jgi:hypothetical protein
MTSRMSHSSSHAAHGSRRACSDRLHGEDGVDALVDELVGDVRVDRARMRRVAVCEA